MLDFKTETVIPLPEDIVGNIYLFNNDPLYLLKHLGSETLERCDTWAEVDFSQVVVEYLEK